MSRPFLARRGRSRTRVIAAGALIVGLSACSGTAPAAGSSGGGSPVAGGTLNVIRSNPFEGFELDKQTLNSSFQISDAVIEPLIRAGKDGKSLEPGLAEKWTYNEDDTVLTIKLDPKATFSDGRPVTAEDVAFSAELWKSGANYGASYAGIKSADVVDEHTVAFTLSTADTSLPAFLSWSVAGVVPKDYGGRSAKEFWQKPVGAGAFTVESWSANGKVLLKKSPHYYRQGRPYLDQVVSTFASDPNSIALQLQSAQADMADEIGPVAAGTLPKDNVKAQSEHLTPVLLMNTKDKALSDAAVRRAIGYAIDYGSILKSAYKGYGIVPNGALPTNSQNWAAPSQPYFTTDAAKAKSLLGAQAPASLSLTYPNDPSSTLTAQIIQQNLQEIGISVKLQSADAASAFATISGGGYQLGLFSYNAISPDVSDPLWYVAATKSMFTGRPADDLLASLAAYAATDDPKKKEAEVTKMQDVLFEDAPFLALAHTNAIEAQRSVVQGAGVTPWGTYYLDPVWKTK